MAEGSGVICHRDEGLTEMMCPLSPWAESAHSITALSCGYPTPVLIRVVHTDPGTHSVQRSHLRNSPSCIYLYHHLYFITSASTTGSVF